MQQDYFSWFFTAVTQLTTQNLGQFESMGMSMFFSFSAILLSWFGVQSALSSASGGVGFQWARFVTLLQELVFCYVMMAFYNTVPIPGLGISFTHLILDQVQTMIAALDQSTIQRVMEMLNALESSLPLPSVVSAVLTTPLFYIIWLFIVAAQALTLAVTMYGYVATSVILLLGPVFIPFKVVPQLEWLFWGWFRAFLQYAFYQVVAAAYTYVFGQFLIQVLGPVSSISTYQLAFLGLPIAMTLATYIFGIIKIPSLVFSIFSGRAGDYVLPHWR